MGARLGLGGAEGDATELGERDEDAIEDATEGFFELEEDGTDEELRIPEEGDGEGAGPVNKNA